MSEIRTSTAAPIVQRILDAKGAPMMHKGDALAWPTFARAAPIVAPAPWWAASRLRRACGRC